jgi:Ca2+-binding RTX toxin-like protein
MSRSPKLAALGAGLATCVALVLPGAASAEVQPPVVEGKKVTITSTGNSADTIKLSVLEGNIAVGETKTTLVANAEAEIFVSAGEGDDVVDASALSKTNYKLSILHGDAGNDLVTGGESADELLGDAGNDQLTGFKGGDTDRGGEGADVMVWNNGDGSDVNDGEAGADETQVNGATTAGDVFDFKPTGAPEQVLFERSNLVSFTITLKAERLTMNGGGGEDTIAPDAAAPTGMAATKTIVTINGGNANDILTGGDGADLINGGDDADTISGGPGNDRLTGDRGGDNDSGQAGDDVMIWNNGDGTDTNDGGPGFDRSEANGSPAEGDAFKLAPVANGATFERTNLVPFAIKLTGPEANGGVEAFSPNGLGGDDSFAASAGLQNLVVIANGDAGNDTLTGAEEPDSYFGGSGNDTLNTGAGADLADGGEGDDKLLARDNTGDLVRGGAGNDSAQTDATTVDAVNGVEKLDATRVATGKGLLPRVGKVAVKKSGKSYIARVPLVCPANVKGGCRTTLTLETAKPARLGSIKAIVVLGSKTVKVRAGKKAIAAIRLSPAVAKIAKRGKIASRLRISSSDAAGNTAVRTAVVNLRLSK